MQISFNFTWRHTWCISAKELQQRKSRLSDVLLIKTMLSKRQIYSSISYKGHTSFRILYLYHLYVYHVWYTYLPNMLSHYAYRIRLYIILLQYKCKVAEVIALQTTVKCSVFRCTNTVWKLLKDKYTLNLWLTFNMKYSAQSTEHYEQRSVWRNINCCMKLRWEPTTSNLIKICREVSGKYGRRTDR
jgi:hypothetical protein